MRSDFCSYFMTLVFIFVLTSQEVYAIAPLIDYRWTKLNEGENCLNLANIAMKNADFVITAQDQESIVGVQGDYKAVIVCLVIDKVGEKNDEHFSLSLGKNGYHLGFFLVSGPNYEEVKRLANFLILNFF